MERKTNKVEIVKIVIAHIAEDNSAEWRWNGSAEKQTSI